MYMYSADYLLSGLHRRNKYYEVKINDQGFPIELPIPSELESQQNVDIEILDGIFMNINRTDGLFTAL